MYGAKCPNEVFSLIEVNLSQGWVSHVGVISHQGEAKGLDESSDQVLRAEQVVL